MRFKKRLKRSLTIAVILTSFLGCSLFRQPLEPDSAQYWHDRYVQTVAERDEILDALRQCLEKGENLRRDCGRSALDSFFSDGRTCTTLEALQDYKTGAQ